MMKIHELLDSPEKWIQGHLAKDANGNPCYSEDTKAVCWCLVGARDKCYEHDTDEGIDVADKLDTAVVGSSAGFNDSHTYSEVLALVKELDV